MRFWRLHSPSCARRGSWLRGFLVLEDLCYGVEFISGIGVRPPFSLGIPTFVTLREPGPMDFKTSTTFYRRHGKGDRRNRVEQEKRGATLLPPAVAT